MRATPVISREIIDEKVTGWVVLMLDVNENGGVSNARITSSTSSLLESPAVEAARRFRYQKELVDDQFVPANDVSAIVYFSYWSLAEAAGCSINNE